MNWRTYSACQTQPDLWFGSSAELAIAMHICRRHCPVLRQCQDEPAGRSMVIGGRHYNDDAKESTHQNAADRCQNCAGASLADRGNPDCGTEAGYRKHLRRKEPVDSACREAHRAYDRKLKDPDRYRPRAEVAA